MLMLGMVGSTNQYVHSSISSFSISFFVKLNRSTSIAVIWDLVS